MPLYVIVYCTGSFLFMAFTMALDNSLIQVKALKGKGHDLINIVSASAYTVNKDSYVLCLDLDQKGSRYRLKNFKILINILKSLVALAKLMPIANVNRIVL